MEGERGKKRSSGVETPRISTASPSLQILLKLYSFGLAAPFLATVRNNTEQTRALSSRTDERARSAFLAAKSPRPGSTILPRQRLHVGHVRVHLEPLLGPRLCLRLQMMRQTGRRQDGRVSCARMSAQLHELHVTEVRGRMVVPVRKQRRLLHPRHI